MPDHYGGRVFDLKTTAELRESSGLTDEEFEETGRRQEDLYRRWAGLTGTGLDALGLHASACARRSEAAIRLFHRRPSWRLLWLAVREAFLSGLHSSMVTGRRPGYRTFADQRRIAEEWGFNVSSSSSAHVHVGSWHGIPNEQRHEVRRLRAVTTDPRATLKGGPA